MSKSVFSRVFTPACNKSATRENAVSGFQTTGIYPLNPLAVPESAFGPSEASERPSNSAAAGPTDLKGQDEDPPLQMGVKATEVYGLTQAKALMSQTAAGPAQRSS